MRILHLALVSIYLCMLSSSGLHAKLIFTDNFDRADGSETSDDLGNGWSTNSKSRAQGDKQTFLRDGTLAIEISPRANHAVSVKRDFPLGDCTVSVRFELDKKDRLGVNFNDPELKTSHAGHVCNIRVTTTEVSVADQMNGSMNLALRERKQSGDTSDEINQAIARTEAKAPLHLKPKHWHELVFEIKNDTVRVLINGVFQLEHSSPGFAHPTKRNIAFSVPKNVTIDDFQVWDHAAKR